MEISERGFYTPVCDRGEESKLINIIIIIIIYAI
jgi:hypothetical protein